jgi:hypothetical protein
VLDVEPTKEELRAITALRRVAKIWPDTLWLFSGSGSLWVMKKGPNGEHVVTPHGGMDPAFVVEGGSIPIDNDGGDWD